MQRPCYYKNRYATAELAQRAADHALADRGTKLRIYLCDGVQGCDGFHLTLQAVEPLKPGWRPPRKSQRDIAHERKRARARRFR